uniref:Wsv026-like protein n=1 Tax=Penaeus semisulcatus majanivirus TaxID=2984274 RepID=A0A9C7C7Z3_9VIRU|nr:MAG: wsv026-like protein [Penaeus semisulcatus majanivirus]
MTIERDRIKWQKDSFPLLFPSEETARAIGSNTFAVPSFEVYESKALLEVGRCESLTRGGMDDCWVDGYVQPRFLLRPMSLITLQGEAVRLFSVQYYKHRGNLGQGDAKSKNAYGGGFIIGDGTGVGKSREIAGMIVTAILVEQYLYRKSESHKPPLIIWLTCSELLFANCKRAFAEVLTLANASKYSLRGMTDNGLTTIDLEGSDLFIHFTTLKSFLADTNDTSDYLLLQPTVLFLTYNGLMANFEDLMEIFDKGIILPTAVFCDEFHKTKNISDKMKWVIQNRSEKYDGGDSDHNSPSLFVAMRDTFCRNRRNKLQLTVADSVKLFVDHLKNTTFFVMSSATPFQNNQDLHMVDHIIRNVAPRYHLLDQYNGTPTGMNSSEYSTLFLESIIKLLYNNGIYVSRTISMKGIRCAIVQKPISAANMYMINEISSYLAEMKCLARTAHSDVKVLGEKIDQIIKSRKWESPSALMSRLEEFGEAVNTGKCSEVAIRTGYRLVFAEWNSAWRYLYDGRRRKTAYGNVDDNVDDDDVDDDDDDDNNNNNNDDDIFSKRKKIKMDPTIKESLSSSSPPPPPPPPHQTEKGDMIDSDIISMSKVFSTRSCRLLSGQLKVNLAACCVAINKNILLSLKNKSVLKYIETVRKQKEPQKMVITVDQTGDSFYSHITDELIKTPSLESGGKKKKKNTISVNRLSVFDKAPASHFIANAYKTLLKIILLDTTYRITSLEKESVCFLLLPRLPPPAPLALLEENFLDSIEVGVGEGRYIEVTKRRYSGRLMSEGTLEIIPINTSAKNTSRDFQLFRHSKSVDVAIVGRSGNTGFDFHDSKDNITRARRIHIIADLPHDAISFLQSIGRTHRNNQRSLPRYCLFLTNIPTEKRFVDTLESRVRDSKAGTYGDRYCQNTISLKKEGKGVKGKIIASTTDVFAGSDTDDNENTTAIATTTDNVTSSAITTTANTTSVIETKRPTNKNTTAYTDSSYVNRSKQNKCIDKIDFLENDFVMKVLGILLQLLAGEYNPLDIFLQIAKLGYRDGSLFIPLEGLGDSEIYLSIVKFAFECAAALLYESKIRCASQSFRISKVARATVSKIDRDKKRKTLDEILERLCYFYDSSIMDVGLRGNIVEEKREIKNLVSVAIQFWKTFSPMKMTKFSRLLVAVKNMQRGNNISAARQRKMSIGDIFRRSAVLVFGYTVHDNVQLPPPTGVLTVSIHDGTMKLIMDGVLSSIPMVAACNLLDALREKAPSLLLDLVNEITPYKKENSDDVESCLLTLSKLLVNRGLTYKQFRNYFMTIPLSEQDLLQSLFSKVQEWLSTEERFSRMCMMRRSNYISAEYTNVIARPSDVSRLYARVDDNDVTNITCDSDFAIDCRLSLCNDNEGPARRSTSTNTATTTASTGATTAARGDINIRLTPENTIFINNLFNTLLLTNARSDMVKFKFWNSEIVGLPSVALVRYQ